MNSNSYRLQMGLNLYNESIYFFNLFWESDTK
jgi:hypothetical protein